MTKNRQRSVISNLYITFYECLLVDYFPNWQEFLDVSELYLIKELIRKFYLHYNSASIHELVSMNNEFMDISKKIIVKLEKEVDNDILLNHFNLINKS